MAHGRSTSSEEIERLVVSGVFDPSKEDMSQISKSKKKKMRKKRSEEKRKLKLERLKEIESSEKCDANNNELETKKYKLVPNENPNTSFGEQESKQIEDDSDLVSLLSTAEINSVICTLKVRKRFRAMLRRNWLNYCKQQKLNFVQLSERSPVPE